MTYELHQGIILKYNKDKPRLCDVMQTPDFYTIPNVRLPQVLNAQSKPKEGSTILVATQDNYRAYMIMVLREPTDYVTNDKALIATEGDTRDQLEPGEIFFESAGDPFVPGRGASFRMGNDGVIELHSGQLKECIIIGGREDDEDEEIVVQADNMFIQSNPNDEPDPVQSIFTFDELHKIKIANQFVDPTGVSPITRSLSELTMDLLGNIVLQNQVAGVTPSAVLDLKITGSIELKNNFGELTIDALGVVELKNTIGDLKIDQTGNVTVSGPTINLNNGTFGVARLNDIVTSDLTTDPAWWLFWSTIATTISALPTTPLDGGVTLKAGLAALFGSISQTIVSKITTASTTVKVGG